MKIRIAMIVIFAAAMIGFMKIWGWFIYDHNAGFIEFVLAMAAIFVVAYFVDRWQPGRRLNQ